MFLGINLSTEIVSLGISNSGQPLAEHSFKPERHFSENLVLEVAEFLNKNNLKYPDLSGIGIINGPGSYTGLRVSITFAKTIAMLYGIPIYGFSTLLTAVNHFKKNDGIYFPVMKAYQDFINLAVFSVNNEKVMRLTNDFSADLAVITNNLIKIKEPVYVINLSSKLDLTDVFNNTAVRLISHFFLKGTIIAEMAQSAFQAQEKSHYLTLKPCYLHKAVK